jgi:energy-coupling factor transporter ATP-binding protein EcfA2
MKHGRHWRCTLPDIALAVAGLWFWYDDKTEPVLQGLDLIIQSGEFVALVGANGSGKTTLTKHFNGLLRPRRGCVLVGGEDTAHRSVGQLARYVGYLFQHPEQQIFGSTVRQEVAFGPHNLNLSPAEIKSRVEAALARFDLIEVADKPPATLSYGLRRRITLASLAAMDSPILVLDEPTVGLDAPSLRETFSWLTALHVQGKTIFLVTHDMALAAQYAERIVVLYRGQLVADGTAAELFQQAGLLSRASLAPPPVLALAQALKTYGLKGDSRSVEAFCDDYVARVQIQSGSHVGTVTVPAPPPEGSVLHSESHRGDRDEPAV